MPGCVAFELEKCYLENPHHLLNLLCVSFSVYNQHVSSMCRYQKSWTTTSPWVVVQYQWFALVWFQFECGLFETYLENTLSTPMARRTLVIARSLCSSCHICYVHGDYMHCKLFGTTPHLDEGQGLSTQQAPRKKHISIEWICETSQNAFLYIFSCVREPSFVRWCYVNIFWCLLSMLSSCVCFGVWDAKCVWAFQVWQVSQGELNRIEKT